MKRFKGVFHWWIINNKKDTTAHFQFHFPRWSFCGGDYYLMLPSLIRFTWGAPSSMRSNGKEYAAGILILGFGVAFMLERYVSDPPY